MSERFEHVAVEVFQAYLEGVTDVVRRTEVDAHLAECARCREEMEGWKHLFRELDELPVLGPSAAFRERVMTGLRHSAQTPNPLPLPTPISLKDRLLALIPGTAANAARHPSSGALQDLMDGILAGPALARTREHVAACGECEREVAAWGRVVAAVSSLPTLRPSDAFAARVMGEFRSRPRTAAAVAPRKEGRLAAAARILVPATRRGWAIAAGIASAPVVGFVVLIGIVAANPLLSVGELFAFVGWQGAALARTGFSRLIQEVTGSGVVLQGYEAVQALFASPGTLVATAVLTGLAITSAAWVMYRNVVVTLLPSRHRVRTS